MGTTNRNALSINYFPTSTLKPDPKNARLHSKKQIRQVANSIEKFGFLVPILIDKNRGILAGHGRLLGAQRLKMLEVPCIQVEYLTHEQKRAFMLADNKLIQNASWYHEILAQELIFLQESDLDFSLEVTGIDMPEINMIIEDFHVVEAQESTECKDILTVKLLSLVPNLAICIN